MWSTQAAQSLTTVYHTQLCKNYAILKQPLFPLSNQISMRFCVVVAHLIASTKNPQIKRFESYIQRKNESFNLTQKPHILLLQRTILLSITVPKQTRTLTPLQPANNNDNHAIGRSWFSILSPNKKPIEHLIPLRTKPITKINQDKSNKNEQHHKNKQRRTYTIKWLMAEKELNTEQTTPQQLDKVRLKPPKRNKIMEKQ